MKNLKEYIIETVKPPRLSAKNRDLWANNKSLDEEEIQRWIDADMDYEGSVKIRGGKIYVSGNVYILESATKLYPFGEVTGNFVCYGCPMLDSLEGVPNRVGGDFTWQWCGAEFTKEDIRKVCRVGGQIFCTKLT